MTALDHAISSAASSSAAAGMKDGGDEEEEDADDKGGDDEEDEDEDEATGTANVDAASAPAPMPLPASIPASQSVSIPVMNGWRNSSAADARFVGSFCRHAPMKAQKAGEKRRAGSRGGGIETILSMITQNERPLLPRRTMAGFGAVGGADSLDGGPPVLGEGGTLSQPYSSAADEAEPLPLPLSLPLALELDPLPLPLP